MKRLYALVWCAILCAPAGALRAAYPLPAELNLIPRDSAVFVSIRVADLWNSPALKPIHELVIDDLKTFEKDNGFHPKDVERVTILVPGLNQQSEPLFIVTTTKPYDLAAVLDALHGYTEAEARQIEQNEGPRFKDGPFPKGGVKSPYPFKDKDFTRPPVIKDKGFPEPKPFPKPDPKPAPKDPFGKIEVGPLPRVQNVAFFGQLKEEPAEKQPAPKARLKRDLTAKYYLLRGHFSRRGILIPVDARTMIIAPNTNIADGGIIALTTQLLRRQTEGPLSMALDLAAGKNAVVVGLNMPLLRGLVESERMMRMLPIRSLLAAKGAAITYNLGDEITYKIVLDCDDEAAAKKAKDLLQAYLVLGREMLPGLEEEINREMKSPTFSKLFKLAEKAVDEATTEVIGTKVQMTVKIKADGLLIATVTEAVQKVHEAAARAKDQNNLKQMAIAVHNYASSYQDRLPFPGIIDGVRLPGKKPHLSWRVEILPFIEQAHLYNQFHLDEPWDSEHNKKLIPLMPKVYEIPGTNAPKGETYYRAFDNLGKYNIGNMPDGTSNTIMIFESAESVIWTKPDDLPGPDIKKMPKLNTRFKGGSNVGMCDGSVRFISNTISARTLWQAFTPDDGEVFGSDW
jgi:prepilin-type processing-associated H-X9-DG protein